MKVPAVVVCTLAAGFAAQGDVPASASRTVSVCMETGPAAQGNVETAKELAKRMFDGIGVRIEWHAGKRHCKNPPEETLIINMNVGKPLDLHPGAFAFALPFEGTHIEVYYDRIEKAVQPRSLPHVLAHVLAHEIAHVLQGVSRHSDQGIMKPKWTEEDYGRMSWKALSFSDVDILLIHRGLDSRPWRLAKRTN